MCFGGLSPYIEQQRIKVELQVFNWHRGVAFPLSVVLRVTGTSCQTLWQEDISEHVQSPFRDSASPWLIWMRRPDCLRGKEKPMFRS